MFLKNLNVLKNSVKKLVLNFLGEQKSYRKDAEFAELSEEKLPQRRRVRRVLREKQLPNSRNFNVLFSYFKETKQNQELKEYW